MQTICRQDIPSIRPFRIAVGLFPYHRVLHHTVSLVVLGMMNKMGTILFFHVTAIQNICNTNVYVDGYILTTRTAEPFAFLEERL